MSGGLESVAAAQNDMLIPGLNFKLPQGASYVSARRFSTFFPQGSNIYSTTGTRLIRFVLSDATNLLDLSTFRLAFQITNGDGTNPHPAHRRPRDVLVPEGQDLRRRVPHRGHLAGEPRIGDASEGQTGRSALERIPRAPRADERGP